MKNRETAKDDEGQDPEPSGNLGAIRARLKAIREDLIRRRDSADISRRKLEDAEQAFSQAQTDVRHAEEARVRHRDARHAPAKPQRK